MSRERRHRVEELFQAAADLPEPQRGGFLDEHCGDDASLRREVEELLAHLAAADVAFLEQPLLPPEGDPVRSTGTPIWIGRYRVIRKIGEGGMGVVYEAEQDHPRRTVALKVVRGGMMSPAIRRRFEHEAEILGQLKHPGIAQIYDAGTSADVDEQPFFAMEYVLGRPIIEHAEYHQLGARHRLDLMAKVCDAVQHAHQKGVIHRDLKPSNILVDETEGLIGQPKILDFGVARALQSDVQIVTMQTQTGQILGTLSYMSPEQIAVRPEELDTRSDVYALGVILFELLGGQLPYDLVDRSIPEVGRIIREHEPVPLSSINTVFRGDIDTIVGKALEKDRERRYSSAAELAADIRRFLNDEPILARPASRIYQLRKFAKRNKAIVGGVLGVFLALALGMAGTGLALVRATRSERIAVERLADSQRQSAKAAAVNGFLIKMLSSADPSNSLGREVTVREVVDGAVKQIESGSLSEEPEIEAEVRITLATTLNSIGHLADAELQLRSALEIRRRLFGDEHADVAHTLNDLALVVSERDNPVGAIALYRQALAIYGRTVGEESIEIAQSLNNLAGTLRLHGDLEEAEALYHRSLDMSRRLRDADHEDVANALNGLGLLLQNKGDFSGAEKYLRESLAMRRKLFGDLHPMIAGSLNNLAFLLHLSGKSEEAKLLFYEALAMRRKLVGNEHPDVAQSLQNLAVFLHGLGQYEEAETLYREANALYRKLLGDAHPSLAKNLYSLGVLARDRGNARDAETLFREAVSINQQALGPDHLDTAQSLAGLGLALTDLQRFEEAEACQRQALRIREEKLPPEHVLRYLSMNVLGAALVGEGRFEEAEPLLVTSFEHIKTSPALTDRRKREALERVIRLYEAWGKPDAAAEYHVLQTAGFKAEPQPQ